MSQKAGGYAQESTVYCANVVLAVFVVNTPKVRCSSFRRLINTEKKSVPNARIYMISQKELAQLIQHYKGN